MRYIFTFYALNKVLLLNKNRKSFKIVFWHLCNFFTTQVTQIILKNDRNIYIFGLSLFTLSAKEAKKASSLPFHHFFSLRVEKKEKAILLPFFPFFDLVQKNEKCNSTSGFSVFFFLYKKRKKAILLPFFGFLVCEQKNEKSNYCTNIHFRYFLFCGNGMSRTEVAVGGRGMG